ncbi:hypothetical protein IFM89_001134 [Coptis chinensis]|uniref:Myb/SANT-like DNA-binding domain-containing protein n=1 Tax=Coptis chinensis TaxID=261450 RepID=A0A835III3_9MAGN|nr:hypothetical protein IFM89_001134 [Coptis chinensis]
MGERYLELSRGNLKQKHWREVADIVSSRQDYSKPAKTDVQCKNRIDTCKKKYKIEKAKIASGQGTSKWIFFHRLDRLIGPNAKINAGLPTTLITAGSKFHNKYQQQEKQPWLRQHQQKQQFQISGSLDSSSSSEAPPSPDSTDSLPPETVSNKRLRFEENVNSELPKTDSGTSKRNAGKGNSWANSLRELSQAISEFGEAYLTGRDNGCSKW